jgi:hypothetical protein
MQQCYAEVFKQQGSKQYAHRFSVTGYIIQQTGGDNESQ